MYRINTIYLMLLLTSIVGISACISGVIVSENVVTESVLSDDDIMIQVVSGRLNYTGVASPQNIYDSAPLDGNGNGVGGLSTYEYVGDFNNDAKYIGWDWFNNTIIDTACSDLGIAAANFSKYHYLINGTVHNITLDFLQDTDCSPTTTDYQLAPQYAQFDEWGTEDATSSNDRWWVSDITTQLNYSLNNDWGCFALRLNMTVYTADGTNDVVYFHTSGDEPYTPFVSYVCAEAGDTCTPTAGEDWEIDASDNCVLTGESYNVGNITFINTGTLTTTDTNITYNSMTMKENVKIISGGSRWIMLLS